MSIKSSDEENNKLQISQSNLKSLSKQLPKEKQRNSRNVKSSSLSNGNSQFSTKEGTPNKDSSPECKTIEVGNINNVSLDVSRDDLSNITKILDQNNYNYTHIKEKSNHMLIF